MWGRNSRTGMKKKRMQKTKVWKLKENGEYNRKIQESCAVEANGKDALDNLWQRIKIAMQNVAVEVCGKTKGGGLNDKDTWWYLSREQRKRLRKQ